MTKTRRTDVRSDVVFVHKLLEQVRNGRLRIPRFQRPFVWRHEDMLVLLDSVALGYPMGSILVWDTQATVTSLDRVGPIPVGRAPRGAVISYVLDGQQRVATLVGSLFLSDDAPPANDREDSVDWRIYYDLLRGEFTHEPKGGLRPEHFPIRKLLSTADYFAACRAMTADLDAKAATTLTNRADHLANAFRDYQVPVITIKEADMDSAVTVFARLNLKGRRMSADQMVSALTYREGEFHLAAALDEYQADTLAPRGFGGLDRTFILRAVLAAMGRDIYAKDWSDLMIKDEIRLQLPDAFDRAKDGINGALGFLAELGATSDRLVPYGLQIVLLAELFRLCPNPDRATVERLQRWFWVTSFTGWFGGVNTAQARQALEEMRELSRGARESFDVVDLEAKAQPFPDRFDARSARVRAFMLFLTSFRPTSIDGASTDLPVGRLLSELGPSALRKVATSLGDKTLASSPANRMYVQGELVGQAVTALRQLDDDTLGETLARHGFPDDAFGFIRDDDREGLIRSRLEYLIDQEREFMQRWNVTPADDRTGSIVADTDMNE